MSNPEGEFYHRPFRFSGNNEVPLSQCPVCGSEVPPEDIDLPNCILPFIKGVVVGILLTGIVALLYYMP